MPNLTVAVVVVVSWSSSGNVTDPLGVEAMSAKNKRKKNEIEAHSLLPQIESKFSAPPHTRSIYHLLIVSDPLCWNGRESFFSFLFSQRE